MAVPHPITVTVNDVDNSTKLEGAKVYVRNATKKSSSEIEKTNSSGIAIIDLANLDVIDGQTEPYEAGDTILIIALHGNHHDASAYTVAGGSKSQTLNMNYVRHELDVTEKIKTLIVANTDGTNPYYARVYSLDDADVILHVECPKGDTKSIPLNGLHASGGFVIEREDTSLIVTAVIK